MGSRRRPRFSAQLRSVTFHRGHDGFLRGKPEPVLLFAAFADARRIGSVARRVLHVRGRYPVVCGVDDPNLFSGTVSRGQSRIVVFGLGLEYDSGKDIAELCQAMAEPEPWKVWAADSALAAPFSLPELNLLDPFTPPRATTMNVRLGRDNLADRCTEDDWVSGAAIVLDAQRPSCEDWEVAFSSADKKNHWVAKLRLRVQK